MSATTGLYLIPARKLPFLARQLVETIIQVRYPPSFSPRFL